MAKNENGQLKRLHRKCSFFFICFVSTCLLGTFSHCHLNSWDHFLFAKRSKWNASGVLPRRDGRQTGRMIWLIGTRSFSRSNAMSSLNEVRLYGWEKACKTYRDSGWFFGSHRSCSPTVALIIIHTNLSWEKYIQKSIALDFISRNVQKFVPISSNWMNYIPSNTMRCAQNITIVYQCSTAIEAAEVWQSHHPWIAVYLRLSSAAWTKQTKWVGTNGNQNEIVHARSSSTHPMIRGS